MSHRILLTGSSGFLGGELARRLVRDGHVVGILVRPTTQHDALSDIRHQLEILVHDGSTEGLVDVVRGFEPNLVYHLASLFISEHATRDVSSLVRSNVEFPTQLLEAMIAADCRKLVNTGTSWQHFGTDDYRPANLYSATKQAFEDILAYYADAHQLSSVTLKLFDTYGKNDRRRKLIKLLLDAGRSGDTLDMSPGEQVIDLVHSDDVVAAFVVAGERLMAQARAGAEAFFVSGNCLRLRDLVDLLHRASGTNISVRWGARPYRMREVMNPVSAKGRCLPGWEPSVALLAGLSELVEHREE